MNIILVALFVVAIYLLYLYVTRHKNYFKDLGIPQSQQFPILGDMKDSIFRTKHISETIKEIYNLDKDAKYVGAYDFTSPVLVIRDLELIKSITVKNFDYFVDRKATIDENFDSVVSNFTGVLKGDKWKEGRRLLTPAFTTSKLKATFEFMTSYSENFVKFIENMSDSERKMLNTKDLFTKCTNDVIANFAFGVAIDSLKNPNNDFYTLAKDSTNVSGPMGKKMIISLNLPWLSKLFNIKAIRDEAKDLFRNVISKSIETREGESIKRSDLIQLMMEARDKTSNQLPLDTNFMVAQAFVFLFGGLETTATQMCTIAHELALNPEIQKKLHSEIDEVVQKATNEGKKVSYEDINGMQYLDAVFNETVRRHPQAPLIDRLCTKSFELPPALPGLKPYTVKPGDVIWLPVSGIHADPKYYEKPEVFDPERFLDKEKSASQGLNLGFGIGPRNCIGMRFATLEVKVLMFYLLSRFNIKKNERTADPYVYTPEVFFVGSSLTPKGGFWLTLEKRNSKS